MPKMEVVSHEYDPETNIDTFVFNPGNLEAIIQVVESDGEPQVLLGMHGISISDSEARALNWSKCPNPAIVDIALEYYRARQ